jgi:hypothetical protein
MKFLYYNLALIIITGFNAQLFSMEPAKKPAISKELQEYLKKGSNPLKIEIVNKAKETLLIASKNGDAKLPNYRGDLAKPNNTVEIIFGVHETPFSSLIIRKGLQVYLLDFKYLPESKQYMAIISKSPQLNANEDAATPFVEQENLRASNFNKDTLIALISKTYSPA